MIARHAPLTPSLLGLVVGLVFAPELAATGGSRAAVTRVASQRIEVVVPATDSPIARVSLADVLGEDLMAFQFRLEATDATGVPFALPQGAIVTLHFGLGATESILRLTGAGSAITLPRPLGVRVGRTEGLSIEVSLDGPAVDGASLHVLIDHEVAERSRSRIAIASEAFLSGRTGEERSWEWTAGTDGRLLAVSGLALTHLGSVELVDATSGEVLWSSALRGASIDAPATATLRMGVPVRAGRAYRLVARGAGSTAAPGLVAMVLPSGSRSTAAVP